MYYFDVIVNVSPSPEPQRHDARRRHEEDEACGREKPAGIAEIHFLNLCLRIKNQEFFLRIHWDLALLHLHIQMLGYARILGTVPFLR